MKTRDILRLIHEDGWYQVAQRGSHRQFKHPTKPGRVTIAVIPQKTWTKVPAKASSSRQV
ncbi:type II toxin-antitoxin system HicA family toxin [Tunturibacter empetritectus]|uniref:RNA binding protein YcfA (HicA-like mRNA interferase family) n=1 Tax=Tunturiibacter lichenicola TaxID=2051959 RepID=A0A7W8N4B8_9BACT|nr:type II toxin-antitoxin system HicA family toxin [Edaphobacter lichenicola]MBB5343411.1 putative RNA binding protein YcfA (HicA-like mRNA interferase family) [Edaphobacter lichenicola]